MNDIFGFENYLKYKIGYYKLHNIKPVANVTVSKPLDTYVDKTKGVSSDELHELAEEAVTKLRRGL